MNDYTIQPIDTAPVDGTRILIYVPVENTADQEIYGWFRGFFDDGNWWTSVWEVDAVDYLINASEYPLTGCKPTHWTPLPPEPSQ